MKKYINKIIVLGTLLFIGASCSDDAEPTTLQEVNFSADIAATPNTVVLSPVNKYSTVTTLSWADVEFPIEAPVTYALEFDVAADTIGATAWENAIRIVAGEEVFSKSFSGAELNLMAIDLGLPFDEAGEIVVRVEATMDRTVYSKAIVLTVTPFFEEITLPYIYVPGTYQGWDPSTAAQLQALENGIFQGYVTFPAGQLEFKFTTAGDWEQFYGLDPDGNFAEGGDTNLSVPVAGSYQITVNLNTMMYTAVPFSWGIIGTATPGGWDSDTDMSFDYVNGVWSWTGNLVPGAVKFRLNDAWAINYGANNNDEGIMYLDNQGAHTVTVAGNYTITFLVNPDPATAVYTIVQN